MSKLLRLQDRATLRRPASAVDVSFDIEQARSTA